MVNMDSRNDRNVRAKNHPNMVAALTKPGVTTVKPMNSVIPNMAIEPNAYRSMKLKNWPVFEPLMKKISR